jgi:ElaB/YqjD/DUF883 family membrane-anchored ribosome-binding protein
MTMPDNPTTRVQLREVKDQVVSEAKNSFRQARDSATSSLTQSRHQAAERLDGIANAMRTTSEHLRTENEPRVADLTESLAAQADRLSSYLRDRDFRGVQDDLERLARQRPAIAIGAALAVGMLAARFFKSSQRTDGVGEVTPGRSEGASYRSGSEYTGSYGSVSPRAGGAYGGA